MGGLRATRFHRATRAHATARYVYQAVAEFDGLADAQHPCVSPDQDDFETGACLADAVSHSIDQADTDACSNSDADTWTEEDAGTRETEAGRASVARLDGCRR